MFRLFALIALAALPATAEELPALQPAESRFGPLTVADTQAKWGDAEQLLLNGTPVQGALDRFVDVRAIIPRPDGSAADWALISMANGGNGCPMMWAFVELTAQGGQVSDRFGTCSRAEEDYLRTTGRSVGLDLPFLSEGVAFVTYYYDGQMVTKFATFYDNVGVLVAGAGPDVTRWSGGHPAAPFRNASERQRFASIMSPEQVQNLATRVGVGSDTITADGYVIGQGFDPASGGDIAALWAIRISDGAPLAIFIDTGLAPLGFGIPEDEWPQAVVDLLGEP